MYASVYMVIISSGNALSAVQHQAITYTNIALLSIALLWIYTSEISLQT